MCPSTLSELVIIQTRKWPYEMTYRNIRHKDNFLDYYMPHYRAFSSLSIRKLSRILAQHWVLHIEEWESGVIKPQLSPASPRRMNSIKSITKILVSVNCQHLSIDILSDYATYALDFQCLQLELARRGTADVIWSFSVIYFQWFLFLALPHIYVNACVCTHTKYANTHVHANAHTFVWPVWANLLYLISSFLDSAAACVF